MSYICCLKNGQSCSGEPLDRAIRRGISAKSKAPRGEYGALRAFASNYGRSLLADRGRPGRRHSARIRWL
jgi:hypothetical protein